MSTKFIKAEEDTQCGLCGGVILKGEGYWLNNSQIEHSNCEVHTNEYKRRTRGDQTNVS